MKLILTQEVEGLGSAGDVIEVKDGYGRNYLVPQKLAVMWTKGGQKTVDAIKSARSTRALRDSAQAAEVKTALEAEPIQVKVRAGEEGRLFGAVTTSEIAAAIQESTGQDVDRRTIVVPQPIKSLGAHDVSVKLHDDVVAAVALNVIPS